MGFLFRRKISATSLSDVHGPTRCVRALAVLRDLSRHTEAIPGAWETIELPLIQAIPDCPPTTKADLVRALEDCATACRQRAIARRIMLVRDSLV